jgi:hypothetical protein
MNMKRIIFLAVTLLCVCPGCIREEPPCPYADIDDFALPEEIMIGKATFNRDLISVYVRPGADVSSVVPAIRISEGASIEPAAGLPQDFRKAVNYAVTAADGMHQRIYTVQLTSVPVYACGFEHWEAPDGSNAFETPVEYDRQNVRTAPWDSSNKGIAIYQQYADASGYPVHKTTRAAAGNYAAEMLTQKGPGSILGIVNIPVVAGSLFTGVLSPLNALRNPLLATTFGQPFDEKPLRLSGKYIYKPGEGSYIGSQGAPHPGKKDSCAVYAVFFRSDATLERLDGTNILTHPNIVAVAMMPPEGRSGTPGDGFADFDIPFEYRDNHTPDFERNTYKLAIVFSSSFMGDYYEGTPGSRLVVDEIEIETEKQ